ncbi:glycosyltransferase [Halopseudomonas pachastrellae]|uniref:glycosyltransferase n=1 Tax=Halopseudomonas pachastrellae TaxID=254161 RepID=UPI003D7EDCB3
MNSSSPALRVLQFCHGYDGPFLDCARQYAALFSGTDYRVTTVFLTGEKDDRIAKQCASDEVLFMEHSSKDIRGLKLRAIRELRQIVKERDFRFCIAHRSKPTYIACLATDLPVIGVHHAFGDFDRLGRRLFAKAFCSRLSLLAVSDAVHKDISARLPRWPDECIQTLHNRIDVEAVCAGLVSKEQAREALKLPDDAWVVGNVGRLHPDKDQATLIAGFARALPALPPGSVLVIMGKGRLEDKLKAQARQLGISDRVIFTGQVPDARRYFKAFDVFALTSDHEPFGMVLLEAMAAGNVMVCSNCGGGPEVVGEDGRLFPLGDVSALATSLQACAELTGDQLQVLRKKQQERLHRLFSDMAARQTFWQLPFMAELKKGLNE